MRQEHMESERFRRQRNFSLSGRGKAFLRESNMQKREIIFMRFLERLGLMQSRFGYGVVRDLCGHGIGTQLHEEPEIPNFRQMRRGIRLRPGMTLAIEPMINMGTAKVVWMDDEWTVVTEDMSLSAHYENTILITEGAPEILTLTEAEIAAGV